jgi:hypothetical protein
MRLAEALVELPDDVAEYKSLSHGWGRSAAGWLSAHVAPTLTSRTRSRT